MSAGVICSNLPARSTTRANICANVMDSAAGRCAVTTDICQWYTLWVCRCSPWGRPSRLQCTSGCHLHIDDAARQKSRSQMTERQCISWSTEVRGMSPVGRHSYKQSSQTRCRISTRTSTWHRSTTRTSSGLDLSLQRYAKDSWSWFSDLCNRMQPIGREQWGWLTGEHRIQNRYR